MAEEDGVMAIEKDDDTTRLVGCSAGLEDRFTGSQKNSGRSIYSGHEAGVAVNIRHCNKFR